MPTIEELKAAAEAFNSPPPQPRKEVTKESDLSNIMRQIQDLTATSEGLNLAQADGDSGSPNVLGVQSETPAAQVESPHPSPPPRGETAALPSTSPASPSPAPPNLPKAPEWLHSIAEVVSAQSRWYGVIFRLGDIKAGKAHGYILKGKDKGGHREFITVNADQILLHGKARVKAKECCSGQWVSEHMSDSKENQ